MIQPFVRTLKGVLPKGEHFRKLPLGPASGCVMAVDFSRHLKAYLGLFEYEVLPHLKRMVTRGSNCFDLGGNDGYWALMLANLSRARVASFECDHKTAENMRRTFEQNQALSIQVIESFVGAKDSEGYITIDKASRNLFPPDFIKMDIEGEEDAALGGASETLAKHRPKMIIEVHAADKEERCISILRSFGYSIEIVNQGKFLKDVARGGHNRWLAAYPAPIQ